MPDYMIKNGRKAISLSCWTVCSITFYIYDTASVVNLNRPVDLILTIQITLYLSNEQYLYVGILSLYFKVVQSLIHVRCYYGINKSRYAMCLNVSVQIVHNISVKPDKFEPNSMHICKSAAISFQENQ